MAGALRKVSLNYNWTIKRAQNDLDHNIFTPEPPTSPSFPDTKPGEFSVLSCDSNHLRWKFKNDYEELREHLERAFVILFGWAATLNQLRTIATTHFINHPIRSVAVLYEESGNLAQLGISSTSIWDLLVGLFRFIAPFIISWFWNTFGTSLIHAPEASPGGKRDTSFVSQIVEHPIVEEPERAPQVSNGLDTEGHVNGNIGNESSGATPLPAISVTEDPKGGNETMPMTHDDTKRFSLRKVRSHNSIKSDSARKVRPGLITRKKFHTYSSRHSPKGSDSVSHHVEDRVVRMDHRTDDVFAIGDYGILAHNPAIFAS